jgi:hypothetical protein
VSRFGSTQVVDAPSPMRQSQGRSSGDEVGVQRFLRARRVDVGTGEPVVDVGSGDRRNSGVHAVERETECCSNAAFAERRATSAGED